MTARGVIALDAGVRQLNDLLIISLVLLSVCLSFKLKKYKQALENIKRECGVVCANFELCKHETCKSSAAAWLISDKALKS